MPKSQGQEATESTKEATVGPMQKPRPTTKAFMPTPRPKLLGAKIKRIRAKFTAITPAEPMPWAARARARVRSATSMSFALRRTNLMGAPPSKVKA